ncbi:MAG TPA: hypothetical protein VHV31_08355, partial [Nitrolancea sp.]|nr:hypothetical protein [Nitrolancea sp.]
VRMDLQERISNLMAATAVGTAVEQDLLRAGIITMGAALTATGGTSAPPLVILDTRRTAFFKRFRDQRPNICARYGHAPFDVPLNEVAAWRLAFAMGDPWRQLVPTAVFRKINDAGGALINDRKAKADLSVFAEAGGQAGAAGFWDSLLGQQDRNTQNFRYDRATRTLALIDHGFSFARSGDLCNSTIFAHARHQSSPVLSAGERAALEKLNAADLHGLRGFIAADRAMAFERRATEMLRTGRVLAPGQF